MLELTGAEADAPSVSCAADRAAAWIWANRNTPIKAGQVAEHCGYNEDYLNRVFKEVYHRSLKQYVDECRLSYIKQLLLSGEYELAEIASRSGFDDYKSFLKYFKYHEKMSPTAFMSVYSRLHVNSF